MILGTGVDIVAVERLARAVDRHGERFLRRVFTPAELAYCESGRRQRAQRLAARFAAKEAVLKALGIGLREVRWTDAEVCRDATGRPSLRLSGRLAEIAAARGAARIHLSLSHTREYAVAQVVIEG
nr:MAG: 4'-phosphopantetheinyl transferase [Bacillota bacterium]